MQVLYSLSCTMQQSSAHRVALARGSGLGWRAYRAGRRRLGLEVGDALGGRGGGVEVPLALHLALPLIRCDAPLQRLHLWHPILIKYEHPAREQMLLVYRNGAFYLRRPRPCKLRDQSLQPAPLKLGWDAGSRGH